MTNVILDLNQIPGFPIGSFTGCKVAYSGVLLSFERSKPIQHKMLGGYTSGIGKAEDIMDNNVHVLDGCFGVFVGESLSSTYTTAKITR